MVKENLKPPQIGALSAELTLICCRSTCWAASSVSSAGFLAPLLLPAALPLGAFLLLSLPFDGAPSPSTLSCRTSIGALSSELIFGSLSALFSACLP